MIMTSKSLYFDINIQCSPRISYCYNLNSLPTKIQNLMDYFEFKKFKTPASAVQDSPNNDQSSPDTPKKSSKAMQAQFDALYATRDRFLTFVSTLGPHLKTDIRKDIIAHCEQSAKKRYLFDPSLKFETVFSIMNIRIQKMIKNKRIKKNWSEQDVKILVWTVSKYSDLRGLGDTIRDMDQQDWQAIASLIPGVNYKSCLFKWLSLKKVNLATNNWSQEQSDLLNDLVNQKGNQGKRKDTKDWKMISQRLYHQNKRQDRTFRNAKQCRQHWNCYLNPQLKRGPWLAQQDIQLIKCIKQNQGAKRWSQIVKHFDGRTQNALKNRYTLIIDKQKKHSRNKSQLQIIEEYLTKCYLDQFTKQINHYEEPMQQQEQEIIYQQQDAGVQKQYAGGQERSVENKMPQIRIEQFLNFAALASLSIDFGALKIGFMNHSGLFQKSQFKQDEIDQSIPVTTEALQ